MTNANARALTSGMDAETESEYLDRIRRADGLDLTPLADQAPMYAKAAQTERDPAMAAQYQRIADGLARLCMYCDQPLPAGETVAHRGARPYDCLTRLRELAS